jgi:neutral ceramidase
MLLRVSLFGFVLLSQLPAARADELFVGRAAVDITPVVGTPMLTPQRPPFELKLAGEAHDPIHVKATVLQQGDVRAAIIECDLTSIPLKIIHEARELIGKSTKIDPASVLIAATHCHTVPQLRARFLGKFDEKTRQMGIDYIGSLPGKIAEAARLAEADLQPAKVSVVIGKEGSVSFNRRYFLRDDTVLTNPFKHEDEKLSQVSRPAGPIDPEVGVVAFENKEGLPLAILINFSLHLDTMGGDQPSADFPYTVEQTLKRALGPQLLSFWASGASGNINHYFLMDPVKFHRTKGPEESARIGAILGAEVLRASPHREPVRDTPLKVAHELVRLDYHPDKAAALLARMKDSPRFFDDEVEVFNDHGKLTFDAEVQVVSLGNELAWVGLPGEMFVEFGLALKNASPFRYTMIHSLANGAIGYVPNRKAYPEGSYEATSTRCAPGSGERLVEAATNLLIKLKDTHLHTD